MKFRKLILAAVLILSLFVFVGCSSDPTGEVKGVTDESGMHDENGTKNDSLQDDLNEVKNDAKDMMDGETSGSGVKDNMDDGMTQDLPY